MVASARRFFLASAAILAALAGELRSICFIGEGITNHTAPSLSGIPSDGGWQWVGFWGGFQGVPIGPHHFIAADHVSGSVGQAFTLGGSSFVATRSFKHPTADLRIWEVRQAFASWAPLYPRFDEAWRELVVFGRGVTRGPPVQTTESVPGVPVGSTAGWYWGTSSGTLRWGLNSVAGFTVGGTHLVAAFDQAAGGSECHLGTGDSSGPVFIRDALDGDKWKLAGVAVAVESGFSTTSDGARFPAFIFDKRGLYQDGSGPLEGDDPRPSIFYAERISPRLDWINDILDNPLLATVALSNLSQTYDGTPRPVAVTTDPPDLTCAITYGGSSTPPTNAGSYVVVATVPATSGYEGTDTDTLLIAKASQAITFDPLPSKVVGDPPFTLTAGSSAGLPVSFESDDPAVAAIAGDVVTIVGPGFAIITATQEGDENHEPAEPVMQTLHVQPAATTVPATPAWSLGLFALLAAAAVLLWVWRAGRAK